MTIDAFPATFAAIQDRLGTQEAVRYMLFRLVSRPEAAAAACVRLGWRPRKLWDRLGRSDISLDTMSDIGMAFGVAFRPSIRRRAAA